MAWAHEPLRYTVLAPVSGGLFRVHGTARSGGATVPWSLVLKVTKSPAEATTGGGAVLPAGFGEDPSHEQYWKREAEAYRTGLLSDLPGRLVAPRCFDVVEHADRGIWLWLEAIDDEYGGTWPLARYGLAARHLGQFNGAYLTGRPLPAAPWLARDWLRQWTGRHADPTRWQLLERDAVWAHPLVRRAFPTPITARVQRLRQLIGPLLDATDRLPQTLCHQDAYSRNLLSRRTPEGQAQTVAVDWANVGPGTIGGDAGHLAAATSVFLDVPSTDFAHLHQLVFEGYLDGLTDAGWRGDRHLVRLGYLGTFLTRWAWMVNWVLRNATDGRTYAANEQRFGKPVAEVVAERAHFVYGQLGAMDEAEQLMHAV